MIVKWNAEMSKTGRSFSLYSVSNERKFKRKKEVVWITSSPQQQFRKVYCDPLRKIKRRIGYIQLEESCATSDGELLGT